MNRNQNNEELEQIIGLRLKIADCNIKLGELASLKEKIAQKDIIIQQKSEQSRKINIKLQKLIGFNNQLAKILNIQEIQEAYPKQILTNVKTIKKQNQQYCIRIKEINSINDQLRKQINQLKSKQYENKRCFEQRQRQLQKTQNQYTEQIERLTKLLQHFRQIQGNFNKLSTKYHELQTQNQQLRQQCARGIEVNIKSQRVQSLKKQCYQLLGTIEVKSDEYLKNYFQRETHFIQDSNYLSKKSKYDFLFND